VTDEGLEEQVDTTKIVVAFRNFANAPQNQEVQDGHPKSTESSSTRTGPDKPSAINRKKRGATALQNTPQQENPHHNHSRKRRTVRKKTHISNTPSTAGTKYPIAKTRPTKTRRVVTQINSMYSST